MFNSDFKLPEGDDPKGNTPDSLVNVHITGVWSNKLSIIFVYYLFNHGMYDPEILIRMVYID